MFILIKSFFWMCWMDFDYSQERTEVRRDYCFSVDICHCALLIYRNYTGPWISLWETRNCPGIFSTTSSFVESFLQRRQSWRRLSYYITNMPFSQPHHTSMMNLPRNMLCQPQIVLYYLTQKKLAKNMPALVYQRKANIRSRRSRGVQRSLWLLSSHYLGNVKGKHLQELFKAQVCMEATEKTFPCGSLPSTHKHNLFCWTESLLVVSQHPLIVNWAT